MRPARARWPLGAALLALAGTPLLAATTAEIVHTRHENFHVIGVAYKAITDGLKSETPNQPVMRAAARELVASAEAMQHWFPKGSGPQPGVKTMALPTVWTQPAKFAAARTAFARQAGVLQQAVEGGDAAAMKVEARKLGATCSACHDTFRDHHH